MKRTLGRSLAALSALGCAGTILAGAAEGRSDQPADALARSVKVLASRPSDVGALISAGKAALALRDANAAAGFFGRANDIHPSDAVIKAGIGSTLVALGRPAAAMPYFAQARQLGASVASIACDRGLAYDLLGQAAAAQKSYGAALAGQDGTEARRRLALSLAANGDTASALSVLQPLLDSGDGAARRTEVFVLALAGKIDAANSALRKSLPRAADKLQPFLTRLAALPVRDKIAAVNLGIFPQSAAPALPEELVAGSFDEFDRAEDSLALSADGTVPGPMQYGGSRKQREESSVRNPSDALALYGVFRSD